jgi:hypothetical protein
MENGWVQLDFALGLLSHQLTGSISGQVFHGQPVTGFWVTQFVNGNVGGALANYTALYRHKSHIACTNASTGQTCL